MLIDRLLNDGSAPVLERLVRFTAQRHGLIAENIANIDTPGYRHKDLSVQKFQQLLRDRLERRRQGSAEPVRFNDIRVPVEQPMRGILGHDGNNRSMEQLATALAKNAMTHNVAVELLRKQYQSIETALKERIA